MNRQELLERLHVADDVLTLECLSVVYRFDFNGQCHHSDNRTLYEIGRNDVERRVQGSRSSIPHSGNCEKPFPLSTQITFPTTFPIQKEPGSSVSRCSKSMPIASMILKASGQ